MQLRKVNAYVPNESNRGMQYPYRAIADSEIPPARTQLLQHALEIYTGETNKVVSVWRQFTPEDLPFRPHPRSSSILEILRHQLLSERRFFREFLGSPEPLAKDILPADQTPGAFGDRLVELARPRVQFLARQPEVWWLARVPFFDVERERI